MEVCRLFSESEIGPLRKTREVYLSDVRQHKGFAETFSTFGRITRLESSIPKIICSSRVPRKETRKLLRCRSVHEASNVPVFQFMRALFSQIGFAATIVEVNPFGMTFRIQPPIYDSPLKQKKTCYTMAEAIFRFFSKDLGLDCTVKENQCVNEGADSCDFECVFDFIAVCRISLDEHDKELVLLLAKEMSLESLIEEGYDKDKDALGFRLDTLKEYGIIDEELALTDKGREFHDFLVEKPETEEDFDPPWKDVGDISSAISAASSFAEALKETSVKKDRGNEDE
jgi:hypothetical protein